ncbi:MAG: Hpt domain-containing protein [Oligoflexales bacterium]
MFKRECALEIEGIIEKNKSDAVHNYESLAQNGNPDKADSIKSLYCNDARISPLIPSFLRSLKIQVSELEKVILADDVHLTKKIIHKLKGGCGSYGFPDFFEAFLELETTLTSHGFSEKILIDKFTLLKKIIENVEV